ncbi:MAG: hypothetical protein HC860_16620 [Alkalinema sp. RU_4_3]|nr:hypothetical protein [Alkalinema sp. RU_4_3]
MAIAITSISSLYQPQNVILRNAVDRCPNAQPCAIAVLGGGFPLAFLVDNLGIYDQFAWHGPSAEVVFSESDPTQLAAPRKPLPRPIAAWVAPALKELQSRYRLPTGRIQISNSADLSASRYEVAALINTFAEEYYKRGIKLQKVDADDFLNMQREFPEELVTLQARDREIQRQKCLARPCE